MLNLKFLRDSYVTWDLRFLKNSYVTWEGRRLQIEENAEFEVFKGLVRNMGAKKAPNHQISSF